MCMWQATFITTKKCELLKWLDAEFCENDHGGGPAAQHSQ